MLRAWAEHANSGDRVARSRARVDYSLLHLSSYLNRFKFELPSMHARISGNQNVIKNTCGNIIRWSHQFPWRDWCYRLTHFCRIGNETVPADCAGGTEHGEN